MDKRCSTQKSHFSLGCFRHCSAEEIEYTHQFENDLKALEDSKVELMELQLNVEQRMRIQEQEQIEPHTVEKMWFSAAKTKITEINNLLAYGYREIGREGHCSKNCKLCYVFGKRVAKKMDDLITLKAKARTVFKLPRKPLKLKKTTLDDVGSCLMNKQVEVVGLVGLRGVGKTTFLKKVYNKFLTTSNDFEVLIWVVVSHDLRLEQIQRDIWTKIGFSDKHWRNTSHDERAGEIFTALHTRKFMLFLDDIPMPFELADIGVPQGKQNGSKVIFTTHSSNVCELMHAERGFLVEPLESEDACELFQKMVGEDSLSMDWSIPKQAQVMAKNCCGLPLTLVATASVMARLKTPYEWDDAAAKFLTRYVSKFPFHDQKLFGVLMFSYDSLPSNKARSCFLYCALFPEGFRILKNDLIDYWIHEEFWDDYVNERDAKDNGYDIIDSLVRSNLLEDGGDHVTMHGMIREAALWVAEKYGNEKEKLLVGTGNQLNEVPRIWEGVTRISLMKNSIRSLTEVPRCPKLVTLLLCNNPRLVVIADGFFQFMEALTVLDLSNSSIDGLPLGISVLVSLQYLNLSRTWIEQLPIELKMLVKLKYLNLENNDLLRMIPREVISSLSGLQVLRIFGCGVSLVEAEDNLLSYNSRHVEELQSLEHLNVLTITITSAAALRNFISTNKLPSCTKALSLKCFWGSKSINISFLAIMKNLHVLEIYYNNHLEEFSSFHSPATLKQKSFKSLQEVIVGKCSRLQDLTWLILAPNLTVLRVTDCPEMEEIISLVKLGEHVNEANEHLRPFRKLKVLELEDLPELKSIYSKALPFPFLQKITVLECPVLKKLPVNPNRANKLRVTIETTKDWWNNVEWEDHNIKDMFFTLFHTDA